MAKFDQTMDEYDNDDYLDDREDLLTDFDEGLSDLFDKEMEQYWNDDPFDDIYNDDEDEEDSDDEDDEEFYNDLMKK